MKIICITVGKKHDIEIAKLMAGYEKRLESFTWLIIPSSTKLQEARAITRQLKTEDYVVLLDERGKMLDNKGLALALENLRNKSLKRLVFIIGGSYGVDTTLVQRSNFVLAFSPLVFPHQIVRLLLVEQLYRTFSILNDGKYHHS